MGGAIGILFGFLCALALRTFTSFPASVQTWVAILGLVLSSIIGLFFGIPGLIFGPFLGALIGELSAGGSLQRSTNVGVAAWIGLIFGTLIKLATSIMMVVLFAAAWWWNRQAG